MIVAFDVETTGLPDFRARSADPVQPHIVQLALVEYSDDGQEITARSMLVQPDGWVIPPEMTAIHGISHERAMDEGVPEETAVNAFIMTTARGNLRVAHNSGFDDRIMRIAMTRAGMVKDFIEAMEHRPSFDTCAEAKPIVNLPPTDKMIARGMTQPKPPKLEECIRHFFGEGLPGAHDALVDARACGRLFFHLLSIKG
ncbi:MAG: 3'-5' exonuclease [Bradyrhizobium sp.]|nr:3'-5' exonuclease [Bradyrhizobium sp.]